ncbi:(E)-4-hydroxy-3-methylbut-2-enyl-diphosphate synthase [Breznakia sp. PF5-3]|uniref:flavodoxin-dependent (E)-4-hydroxy-3-methylbut-2-enyl-diphosphate synthase n=1 Tax=unclassified Breznakia TaxID=2623764 RepID=UPI0024049BF7|nr:MULTISPECIES: flavodoxin-dependent (E)-4-hydroxy-3-methylbut-2-enyl-diphosphate synthase [unclassified Breznakia]MDF9824373.1 (E)-4-hydroxy-3-methylbut-2-enyl-diphosphate synthase [Breznakia sp. PM6-1]MDF9835102.1 (E)-4-hydroxy-3-methylbut-2-enyl-diphosphate synthase [Breznakia sp. PF5-3]MDF9838918.1 (E)-4-hydroxy-3-methylbut-2-enyl-diphosphate synthase [Breznakia sp. PFB2-8]MDF9860934.1 (E)-4-hydroxy-3-methylbut-2-enyl-diphosphate synthase [Breznakia sp. PH5-24]
MKREKTRQIMVKDLAIGGQNKIVIQSMCSYKTSDTNKIIKQINDLEHAGCEIIRVSIMDEDDAIAIQEIKKHTNIPIVGDIHFNYKLAIKAIENGIDKIRLNPGNIGSRKNVEKVVALCKENKIPIRIGINSGSLEKDIHEKYGKPTAEGMIESAKRHIQILEDMDFYDICLSFKSSDVQLCIDVYTLASEIFNYPLHLGVTEAGSFTTSSIKSSVALGTLIERGIGDTIRVSVNGDPLREMVIVKQILKCFNLIKNVPNLIACPTCGRTQFNIGPVVDEIETFLETVNKDITVAIMGCAVNGPGEAKHADIAIAGGKNEGVLIKKGVIIEKIPQEKMVERLKEEILAF